MGAFELFVTTMLRSLGLMIMSGPDLEPENFFDVLRPALFDGGEFPKCQHHPMASELLLPWLSG